jgi:carbon starvation protein
MLDMVCRLQRYVIQELASTLSTTNLLRSNSQVTLNPLSWLTNKHGATIFATSLALLIASLPAGTPEVGLGEAWSGNISGEYLTNHPDLADTISGGGVQSVAWWLEEFGGKGGLLLWPLFGATNQLLAGLAFLVIAFYLWRRNIPVWFIVIPMLFMLTIPAWAMLKDIPRWMKSEDPNWLVITVGILTLALEVWMLVEAFMMWPKVKGLVEESPNEPIKSQR